MSDPGSNSPVDKPNGRNQMRDQFGQYTLTTRVLVETIITTLEANRERYVSTLGDVKKIYRAQAERYKEEYSKFLEKELKGELTEKDKDNRPSPPQMPADRTETYNMYIAFFKSTMDTEIIITQEDFNRFLLDKWDFVQKHIRHLRHLAGGDASYMVEELQVMASMALDKYS